MKVKGREITHLLVSLATTCLLATPGSRACPRRCACYVPTEVHCTFRYLTSVPGSIPPKVERINLGYNSLARLTQTDFRGLNKLELLLLHSNGIHTVPDRTFSDLQALQVLKLSYNKVQKIQKDTFYGLRSLTRLHVDHNSIEFINPEAFHGLSFLRLLHLEGNRLTKLHPDTFVSLRYLQIFKISFIKYLYLSDNFLTSLPQEMVSCMPYLESLYLHGNPWTCDCRLKWLSDWMQKKPDVIKCKKDRSTSSLQQCPLCMNPRISKGKPFAEVPAAAFLCTKPTIESTLEPRGPAVLDGSGSAFISPRDFMAPLGSLTLNLTDLSGKEAKVVCSVQKPSRTWPIAFSEEKGSILLNTSFSTSLVCNIDDSRVQPVWQLLALYSDSPLILERSHTLSETPQLSHRYKQVALKPEDIFTNIEAGLEADPPWLMQDQICLQLDRRATTLSTLHIQLSSEARVRFPRPEGTLERLHWTMILGTNNTKLEHTVLTEGTVALDCPGQGDPSPHLEWLLADGSKARAPYISEDGRILIDTRGRLELRMADSSDTGTYHCVSTNYHDADVLTYRITVVEPDDAGSTRENKIHQGVVTGETLDLPCPSTGIPDASISWVLPGNTVLSQSSGGKQVLHNGTLRILQVTPKDQGHYHCIAANPSGVESLTFQVSVKLKGPRAAEHDGETDGSGLEESRPGALLKQPPPPRLSASASMSAGAKARTQASSRSENGRGVWQSIPRRQGHSSNHRRFREHRRQFPPSARRIDPQHWAALLEKAKMNAVPEKQENATGRPPPPVTPLVKTASEGEESSGLLSLNEEFSVLETTVPSVSSGTLATEATTAFHNLATNGTSGPEVSPAMNPQRPQATDFEDLKPPDIISTVAITTPTDPTMPSKAEQGATSPNPTTHFPGLPGVPGFQDAGQEGRRSTPLPRAYPVTGRAVVTDSHLEILESASPTGGPQTPTPEGGHLYSHSPLHSGTSRRPPGPHRAPSRLQMTGNSTAHFALSGRSGRRRKTWGRGRMISPSGTPLLRRHRYGAMRPAHRGAADRGPSAPPATRLQETCPSCRPPESLPTATSAAPLVPGSAPNTLQGAEVTQSPPAQYPTLLLENKDQSFQEAVPTMTSFGAESTQVTLTHAIMMSAPTFRSNITPNNNSPSAASTRGAKRDLMTTPLSAVLTKPSVPTKEASTTFSRRKLPWNHILTNNPKQKGVLKNLNQSVLQPSTTTVLPKRSPISPTDKVSRWYSTTPSESGMGTPPATHVNTAGSVPAGKGPPASLHPLLPNIPSNGPRAAGFLPGEMVSLAAPTTPVTVGFGVHGPRAEQDQRKKKPERKNDSKTPPGQSWNLTKPPAVTLALTTAPSPIQPSVSAFTRSPLQDPSRAVHTPGLHAGTWTLTGVTQVIPQQDAETLRSTGASETALFNRSQESTTTGRKTSAAPPLPGSRGPLVPLPTSPFTHSPVTENLTIPFQGTTDTGVTRHEPSVRDPDLQASSGKVTAPPEAHPHPELMAGGTGLTHSTPSPSPPVPSLRPVSPQTPGGKPSPWPESPFQHQSYSDIAGKDKKAATSMVPSLSLPQTTSPTPQRNGWRHAKGSFDRKPVPDTTSKLLPSNSAPGNSFTKPRIVGGKAASFTVPANSDALLPCPAEGTPRPSVHWTRVSSGLDLTKRTPTSRFHVLPNGTLSIRNISTQDRGQYVCSVSNPLGTDHLHVTLSVVSYPPRILERRTKEITVHSGSSVELECKVEGRPSPAISWILANQTVVTETSQEKTKALVKSDGTLVLRNLSIYDRGFYKCLASNLAGQDWLLVRIQVIAAPPVILEEKRQAVAGIWGDSLKLPCTARGTPQPRVHWVLSDGTEVQTSQFANSKFLLYSNGTLHIRSVTPSDRGTYECIATSPSGSERRVVVLTVEQQETLPRIEDASQKWTEVNLGDKLLLHCSATGDPKPRIIWRLPSKAVVDQWHRMGSRLHVYPNGSLLIGSVSEKDAGDYLCVARNKMGDDLTLMHVSLRLTPAKIDHKYPVRKQVLHGKDFQVDCKASGSPVPEVSWSLPDGTMINNAMQADDSGRRARRYTLFHNGTLYFKQVGVAEEGDYTCYAQNTLGKDEMKVHVTVVTPTPRVSQGSKTNLRIQAGDTAVLDCGLTRGPKPQTYWTLPSRDTVLFSKDRYTVHGNGSLSIQRVKLLDSGEYVCAPRNPGGGDVRMYRLEVVSKPPFINGLFSNKTIKATALQHSRKLLDCRADGIPAPQITWVMPGNIFLRAPYYGSRVTVHPNGTLELRNVRLSDSARFVCVVRNAGGQSVLVVELDVLEMLRRPTFRNPFNAKVVAQQGKPTALNCSVDGNPPPEITWILPDGTPLSKSPQSSQYLLAGNGSLLISKVSRSHAGKYRCAARNPVGYIEKLIVLEIGQKPVILTYVLGVVKGVSGEPVALHCVTDGVPKPSIKWTTPGGYVLDRPQVHGRYILHENGTLVIRAAAAYDRGNYVCQAHNSVGHTLVTVPVAIVAYPPRIVTGPPKSILARTGVAFRLHCVALGVPKPEVTWEMPGHSSLSKTRKGGTQRSEALHLQGTLVIQDPQTSDSGFYRCLAKSPLGSDQATTYVQVL